MTTVFDPDRGYLTSGAVYYPKKYQGIVRHLRGMEPPPLFVWMFRSRDPDTLIAWGFADTQREAMYDMNSIAQMLLSYEGTLLEDYEGETPPEATGFLEIVRQRQQNETEEATG